jgi:hypothetical protein
VLPFMPVDVPIRHHGTTPPVEAAYPLVTDDDNCMS